MGFNSGFKGLIHKDTVIA